MNLLRGIDRLLTKAVGALLVIFFTLMLGLAVLQVGLRFFLHTGILWGDVAARNLVIWVGFFGAYLATREDKHFRIDILTRFLPERVRTALAALTDLFVGVICYFLLRASIRFVTEGFDPDAVAFLGIPQYVIAMIVPVGFALMIVQFFVRAMESLAVTIKPPRAEVKTP
jgi:TRAP-type C4-dicarboxylate transport system permease small subunit